MTEPVHSAFPFSVALAWIGGAVGTFTLSEAVLWSTLVVTIINIFFTIRDRWWRDRPAWREKHSHERRRR